MCCASIPVLWTCRTSSMASGVKPHCHRARSAASFRATRGAKPVDDAWSAVAIDVLPYRTAHLRDVARPHRNGRRGTDDTEGVRLHAGADVLDPDQLLLDLRLAAGPIGLARRTLRPSPHA